MVKGDENQDLNENLFHLTYLLKRLKIESCMNLSFTMEVSMNKKDKLKMLIAVLMDLLCAAAVIVFYFNPAMFNKVNEFVVYAVVSFLIMVVLLLTYAIVDFVWHKQNYEGRYGFGAVFLSHVELFSYGFIAFWFMVYEGLLTLYGWKSSRLLMRVFFIF